MRQLTGIFEKSIQFGVSKLPMRQLTIMKQDASEITISKLPMRQLTNHVKHLSIL